LINKYIDLMKESKLYLFIMIMCPDRKVDWFKNNDFSRDEIRRLKISVIAHWVQKYGPGTDVPAGDSANAEQKIKRSKWESSKAAPKKKHPYDHIETYLQESTISSEAVANAGGYMAYWHAA
ncbi:hypothetical protein M413DRAFT_52653, partial [Hebeloma cylindrosporum]